LTTQLPGPRPSVSSREVPAVPERPAADPIVEELRQAGHDFELRQ
jgi:hypothetical protein